MGQEQGLLLEAQDVIRSKGDSSITAIEWDSIDFVLLIFQTGWNNGKRLRFKGL